MFIKEAKVNIKFVFNNIILIFTLQKIYSVLTIRFAPYNIYSIFTGQTIKNYE